MHDLPSRRHRTPWLTTLPAAVASLALAAPDAAPPATPKPAPKQSVAEFDAVSAEMKKLVGELAVLQAKYHQPGADKPALEARFEETRQKAQAGAERLEEAAFQLVAADPHHKGAREICGAVIATSLQSDDPRRALAAATRLEQVGAADESTLLMAASAALVASELDAAKSFLAKATAAGAPKARTAELAEAIEREGPKIEAEQARRKADAEADDLPRVKLSTTVGDLVVELFENEAPNTVANFISLVEQGFYDGTPFHRVIGGFMAQGGDPTGSGRGGPGYAIPCEVNEPGARKHFLGTLSMAHTGPDTGGSQFFLTFRPTDHLDGKHTVFGRVIEGFDVLPRLIRTQDPEGRPVPGVNPDKITKAEVLRKRNHSYEPKKLPDPRK
jgi:cyclophilin family peptidyl-prolyl cis-trans isomerase